MTWHSCPKKYGALGRTQKRKCKQAQPRCTSTHINTTDTHQHTRHTWRLLVPEFDSAVLRAREEELRVMWVCSQARDDVTVFPVNSLPSIIRTSSSALISLTRMHKHIHPLSLCTLSFSHTQPLTNFFTHTHIHTQPHRGPRPTLTLARTLTHSLSHTHILTQHQTHLCLKSFKGSGRCIIHTYTVLALVCGTGIRCSLFARCKRVARSVSNAPNLVCDWEVGRGREEREMDGNVVRKAENAREIDCDGHGSVWGGIYSGDNLHLWAWENTDSRPRAWISNMRDESLRLQKAKHIVFF